MVAELRPGPPRPTAHTLSRPLGDARAAGFVWGEPADRPARSAQAGVRETRSRRPCPLPAVDTSLVAARKQGTQMVFVTVRSQWGPDGTFLDTEA